MSDKERNIRVVLEEAGLRPPTVDEISRRPNAHLTAPELIVIVRGSQANHEWEQHAADCARCQRLLEVARAELQAPEEASLTLDLRVARLWRQLREAIDSVASGGRRARPAILSQVHASSLPARDSRNRGDEAVIVETLIPDASGVAVVPDSIADAIGATAALSAIARDGQLKILLNGVRAGYRGVVLASVRRSDGRALGLLLSPSDGAYEAWCDWADASAPREVVLLVTPG